MYYIGVDLGTSAVKILLMNEKGEIKKIVSRDYPLHFPKPGWSEQEPADWWKQVMDGLKELLSDIDKSQVRAIGAGGQMHGLVILDDRDQVIRPAILWNDGRTQEETEELNQKVGKDKLREYTGNIAFAGFTAPKILWVRKHEPENFQKIRKIMLPKDYINYLLTGSFVTDYSDASGMLLLDVKNKCWSDEMLSICGIRKEQLPKLHESYEEIGTLRPEVAKELGIPESVRVCAGAGDNAAAAIGTGTVGEGTCNISLGTSGTVFIPTAQFTLPSEGIHSFVHADGGYHLMGCMLSAASCNKWMMEEILQTKDYDAERGQVKKENWGRNQVFYLPYLMGERAPHNDPSARSCFIGMSMDTKRVDLVQAMMEGVAFGMRDSLEEARKAGIVLTESMICGGGSRNPIWRNICANIWNLTLKQPETEQGPGYGGAILAAVCDGAYASVEEAVKALIRVKAVTEPDPEIVSRYEERYQVYRELYPALKHVFPKLTLPAEN
jgi:xylulokinase